MLHKDTEAAFSVENGTLPNNFLELFASIYDENFNRFITQESTIIDFKENIPESFASGYGAGIIRLAIAFHNTHGGLIVFGVKDRELTITGTSELFDIESFNRAITDFTGSKIECALKQYTLNINEDNKTIQVVLVKRRGISAPVKTRVPFDKYSAGTLWVRDRHEVVEAETKHFSLLFSDRSGISSNSTPNPNIIHKSLPPSPSTIEDFIGRRSIMHTMWEWLTIGSKPRIYLHGTGGSGKSTLAYEFARSVCEAQNAIALHNGENLDYVIYISAKETSFNPLAQKESFYDIRDFSNSSDQLKQIIFHSSFATSDEINSLTDDEIHERIDELTSSFNGLIIIDDIDALSRSGKDTGEELLFLKAAQSSKRTRILYTLRFPPPHALTTAIEVPGLDPETEYFDFIESCSRQFGVKPPIGADTIKIGESTDYIPLLVETVVGLRKSCSSYGEAISAFESKGGDGARRYLYQREYDRLGIKEKSRQLLAAMSLLDSPVTFRTLCDILATIPEDQIRDAISETQGIFLRTIEGDNGDTLYELAPPAVRFVKHSSQDLPYIDKISKSVEHFKNAVVKMSHEEASAFARINRMHRDKLYEEAIEFFKAIPENSPIVVNPKILSTVGQCYSQLGPKFAEDARQMFKQAFAMKERNIFMLRDWFYLEFNAPHTLNDAEKLCREISKDKHISQRHKAEFTSKLAMCLDKIARTHIFTNPEKAVKLTIDAINSNISAYIMAEHVDELDSNKQLEWLTNCVSSLYRMIKNDVDPIFTLIETWPSQHEDVSITAVKTVMEPLRMLSAHLPSHEIQRFNGLIKRTLTKLSSAPRRQISEPGFSYVVDSLKSISSQIATNQARRSQLAN